MTKKTDTHSADAKQSRRPLRGPRTPDRLAAVRALTTGDYPTAARTAERVLAQNPQDADMHRVIGIAAANFQQYTIAVEHLARACALAPDDPLALAAYASVLHHSGDDKLALATLDQAFTHDPSHPVTASIAASIHRALGDPASARAALGPALAEPRPDPSVLVLYADLAAPDERERAAADLVHELERPDINPVFREQLHSRVATLYDKLGREDDAWAQLKLQHAATDHPPRVVRAEPIEQLWTPDTCAALPQAARSGERVVLVVGMPRSGTTLTESILAAHPHAVGIGESPMLTGLNARIHRGERSPVEIEAMASDYHAGAARAARVNTDNLVVVDKMPSNIYLLYAANAVLPGCRLVRCRRDPRDVLLSCLFQNFHNRLTFAKDPEACARQIVETERIDAYWRQTLALDVLDFHYEQVVADLDTNARRLVAHAGLGWDDACLRFHERDSAVRTASVDQVRRPIYTSSVGKWRRYERYLAPAIEILHKAGVLDEYD